MTQTRTEIEDRIRDLRRDRGAATLAGTAFDSSVIADAEAELAAADDAAAEQARRRREASAAVVAKQREILQVELAALSRSYLADAEMAEASSRAAAAALGRMLEGAGKMVRLAHHLSGKPVPIPLIGTELVRRLGHRHAAVMGTIQGHHHRLGPIEWLAGHYTPKENWRDAEEALLVRHVQPLTEKDNGNGKS